MQCSCQKEVIEKIAKNQEKRGLLPKLLIKDMGELQQETMH